MLVYFMRHAEAEDAGPGGDAERALTERGARRTAEAAAALRKLDLSLALILTSPLRRAVQTAEIVGRELQVPVRQERLLAGHLDPGDLAPLLEACGPPQALMLVGHEPTFSWVIGELIGGAQVEVKKGSVTGLQVQALVRGGAVLRWLLAPRQLSLLS